MKSGAAAGARVDAAAGAQVGRGQRRAGLVVAPLPGSWMRKCPCAATVPDSANTCAPLGTTVLVGARYCSVSPVSAMALEVGL